MYGVRNSSISVHISQPVDDIQTYIPTLYIHTAVWGNNAWLETAP